MKLRILVASGPTQEPLDPVRFLSNYSTGTMGKYLAEAAQKTGHSLTHVQCPRDAQTARELLKKLSSLLPKNDVLIMAAAVCDVHPASFSAGKIKKDKLSSIRLAKNPDILATLSKKKKKGQVFIGFGLESKDIVQNGFKKIQEKKLEAILMQRVTKNKTPFGDKPIEAIFLEKSGQQTIFSSVTKRRIANFLVRKVEAFYSTMVAEECDTV